MNPVVLPPSLARCPSTRQVPCCRADSCAHALVAHSPTRPVQDFSHEVRPASGCIHYLNAAQYRPAPDAARPVRDWIGS
jgi:hypothetical protein